MLAVHKLRAQFDREVFLFVVMREDASANAFARFKDDDCETGLNQFFCAGKSGDARADDDDIRVVLFHVSDYDAGESEECVLHTYRTSLAIGWENYSYRNAS